MAALIGFRVPGDGPLHLRAVDDGTLVPAQVVEQLGGVGFATTVTPDQISMLTDLMRGPELAGSRVTRYELDRTGDDDSTAGATLTCVGAGTDDPVVDLGDLRDDVLALAAEGVSIAVRVMRAPRREIVARVEGVPGFGWRTFEAVDGPGPATALRAEEHLLENEHLRVEVDPHTGTYTITTADGVEARDLGRLVEGGDGGDTYNYSPPAAGRRHRPARGGDRDPPRVGAGPGRSCGCSPGTGGPSTRSATSAAARGAATSRSSPR